MTVYELLGARPVVNCRGVYSELGGAIVGEKVWAAMSEANGTAASMSELLEATGRRLADLLGAEAARVVPGAAAAIALGTAACMTRGDGEAAERLPDAAGLPNEIVFQRVQLPHYKYARVIVLPGAQLTLVDSRDELEHALDPARVAAAFVPAHLDELPGAVPLREVAALARERGIPTLADAAFLNYPPESMRRFTAEGADLVCFSAKYFYGPNTGGFVVGRADLVDAVAAVDFTNFETGTVGQVRPAVQARPAHRRGDDARGRGVVRGRPRSPLALLCRARRSAGGGSREPARRAHRTQLLHDGRDARGLSRSTASSCIPGARPRPNEPCGTQTRASPYTVGTTR